MSTSAPTRRPPVVIPLDTPTLGDRSYLAHDGEVALVVDPQRDIDRVLDLAAEAGVRITHVVETHLHNDYLTGGLALAQATGATYHVNGDDDVAYDRSPVRDGDVVEVSSTMRLRAIATPGHTFTHLAYAPEIASAMLQRQQAGAVVAARRQIVDGAVGMVEAAIARITERDIVELDSERKAAMVSNLMVVLCGDRAAQPVLNTGSLYQ